jgi:hypothetical protein
MSNIQYIACFYSLTLLLNLFVIIRMKIKSVFLVFFITGAGILVEGNRLLQSFNKPAFYAVMKSGEIKNIDSQLVIIDLVPIKERNAYEGALLMKKAGLVQIPSRKLHLFNAGRIKLETAILKDSSNVEYRFLRLSIQEHAPKIVKYHSDITKDRKYVEKYFNNLPLTIQMVIIDYSKTSKILHQEDFNMIRE